MICRLLEIGGSAHVSVKAANYAMAKTFLNTQPAAVMVETVRGRPTAKYLRVLRQEGVIHSPLYTDNELDFEADEFWLVGRKHPRHVNFLMPTECLRSQIKCKGAVKEMLELHAAHVATTDCCDVESRWRFNEHCIEASVSEQPLQLYQPASDYPIDSP